MLRFLKKKKKKQQNSSFPLICLTDLFCRAAFAINALYLAYEYYYLCEAHILGSSLSVYIHQFTPLVGVKPSV